MTQTTNGGEQMTYYRAGEVLQKAVEMERKGAAFYESIAKSAQDAGLRDLCLTLAEEEKRHEAAFGNMLSEHGDFRTEFSHDYYEYLEGLEYLSESGFFKDDSETVQSVLASENWTELILAAMRIERDSILYYQEMKPYVNPQAHPVLEDIIGQERGHFQKLLSMYRSMTDQ